jgi:hypothetical protein
LGIPQPTKISAISTLTAGLQRHVTMPLSTKPGTSKTLALQLRNYFINSELNTIPCPPRALLLVPSTLPTTHHPPLRLIFFQTRPRRKYATYPFDFCLHRAPLEWQSTQSLGHHTWAPALTLLLTTHHCPCRTTSLQTMLHRFTSPQLHTMTHSKISWTFKNSTFHAIKPLV